MGRIRQRLIVERMRLTRTGAMGRRGVRACGDPVLYLWRAMRRDDINVTMRFFGFKISIEAIENWNTYESISVRLMRARGGC